MKSVIQGNTAETDRSRNPIFAVNPRSPVTRKYFSMSFNDEIPVPPSSRPPVSCILHRRKKKFLLEEYLEIEPTSSRQFSLPNSNDSFRIRRISSRLFEKNFKKFFTRFRLKKKKQIKIKTCIHRDSPRSRRIPRVRIFNRPERNLIRWFSSNFEESIPLDPPCMRVTSVERARGRGGRRMAERYKFKLGEDCPRTCDRVTSFNRIYSVNPQRERS